MRYPKPPAITHVTRRLLRPAVQLPDVRKLLIRPHRSPSFLAAPVNKDKGFKVQIAGSEVEYDRIVHQLGKLALIEKAINAPISNQTSDKKQNGFRTSDFILTRHLSAPIDLGKTKADKVFENVPYFKEWDLRTLTDRQNMFRDLALKTWGFEQMPFFSSTLG
jgi:Protein of unknown function (DUF1524)